MKRTPKGSTLVEVVAEDPVLLARYAEKARQLLAVHERAQANEPIDQKITIVLKLSEREAAEAEAEVTGESRSAVIRRWMQPAMRGE